MNQHKPVVHLALFTILSRIIGFIRVIAIGALLGTTLIGNTFQSTNSISNVLFDLLVSGALSAALIPQLSVALHKGKEEFDSIISSLLTVVLIVLGIITIVGFIFAQNISNILFQNVPITDKSEQIRIGTILIRFFIPQVFFYGIGAVSVAALSAKKIFTPAAYAPIAGSFVIIIGLSYFRYTTNNLDGNISMKSIVILGLSGTFACLGFVLTPFIIAIRKNINFRPSSNIKLGLESLKTSTWAIAIQASAAIILGISIYIGNKTPGAVVAYQIGFIFFFTPYAIISQSFSTVALPEISVQAFNSNDLDEKKSFNKNIHNTLLWTYIPLSIISALVISFAQPISNILSIGEAQSGTKLFEYAIIFMFVGLLPYGLFQTCSIVFFAISDVKTPALIVLTSSIIISIIGLVVSKSFPDINILMVMGLIHGCVYLVASIILITLLSLRKINVLPNKSTIYILFSSFFIGVCGYFFTRFINPTNKLDSIIYIAVSMAMIVALLLIITPKSKIKEYINMIRNRGIKNV
jgi:putative peptidoglycan lipid II flippase